MRGRENEARFGLPWLSEEEQRKADDDSVLWLRTLQLMTVALDESMECAIGLEQPEDPANWKEDDENLHGGWGYPSFMVWPETVAFAQLYGLDFVNFDQKLLGHKRKEADNDGDEHRHNQGTTGKEVYYPGSTVAKDPQRKNGRISRLGGVGNRATDTPT